MDSTRVGSGLKVDYIRSQYILDPITGKKILKEFPTVAQSHGFNDIIDNYAGYATKTQVDGGTLYQIEGSLNGVEGRFEWILEEGYVVHRMFVKNGTINGVPIKK